MTPLNRRTFLKQAGFAATALSQLQKFNAEAGSPSRSNILWLVSEDNNPFLGCYGYRLARTPVLDRLASEGLLYENCFSQAPVCAPSRFTLITGMYATSCGPAEHMRAQGKIPSNLRGFPAYLRDAGYYCTNNAKTDYNAPINMKDTWDESSNKAHWRNRPPGKPFFAVFNHEVTHESQLFAESIAKYAPLPTPTDPAKVVLPAYHPDLPEFRVDWANYFDLMARLDEQIGKRLAELEADGLAEDTIVFYYGDNGGVLPRSKRFCFDSGTHVPLIIRFPKKYRDLAPANPGTRIDAPVSFVDFAATVLSVAGVDVPKHMQGHALAGRAKSSPQQYAFSFRNRMDERYDMVRTARDNRYRYLRNYMPHLIYGQHVDYMFRMRSMAAWEKAYREGRLSAPQTFFWEEKPAEELYDLHSDPYEVKNLAADPGLKAVLDRMRAALRRHMLDIRDNGFIPEGSPTEGFDSSRDPGAYPLERIIETADTAIQRNPATVQRLIGWLADEDECIRYWATLGCVMLREKAAPAAERLAERLKDSSHSVRVAAAEALCYLGREDEALAGLERCLRMDESPWVRLQAANSLQNLGLKALPALRAIEQAASDENNYVQLAAQYTAEVLKQQAKGSATAGGQ
jgi:arylsulfatase A-like enzyme